MKKFTVISLILIVALLMSGCAANHDAAAKSVISAFQTAANAKDYDALLNTLTPDTARSLKLLVKKDADAFDKIVTYLPFLSSVLPTTESKKTITITPGEITANEDSTELFVAANVTIRTEGEKETSDISCYFELVLLEGNLYISNISYLS